MMTKQRCFNCNKTTNFIFEVKLYGNSYTACWGCYKFFNPEETKRFNPPKIKVEIHEELEAM